MEYIQIKFKLMFEKPMDFHVRPLYLFRSVMGASLHSLCCSNNGSLCKDCSECGACIYSEIFEGHRKDFEGKLLRPVHPFTCHIADRTGGKAQTEYAFIIKVFGSSIKWIPYLVASFMRAGEIGAGKDKIKFRISVFDLNDNSLCYNSKPDTWEENIFCYNSYEGTLLLKCITPLRFKYNGKYGLDFNAEQFLLALRRRYVLVVDAFGSNPALRELVSTNVVMKNCHLRWNEANHWSSRQKTNMQIGGAVGFFELEGSFSAYDMMLLDFASKFCAGKNTTFGLGNLEVWKK